MTKSQILSKYGEDMGNQILDAAAGRRPPFTRDFRARERDPRDPLQPPPETEEEMGEEVTGKHQDRGPVHLLPRPISYNMPPEQFFKYWAMVCLDREAKDRIKVYPYRLWPVTDVNQLLNPEQLEKIARRERRPPSKSLPPGPLKDSFDPQKWEAEIYHRYGAGDYNFILVDKHPAVRRNICMTNVIGLRDMDTYPPVVDMRTLVQTDPANESYIRWCSMKGIRVPGRDDEDNGGEDVAATKILAEALVRERQQPQQHPRESTSEAIGTVTKMMADASRANTEALIRSMEQQRKAEDPIEFHERVMKTAQILSPQGAGAGNLESIVKLVTDSSERASNAMKDSNKIVMDMVLSGQKSLEARLAAAEARNAELQNKLLEMTMNLHKAPDPAAAGGVPGFPRTPMDAFSEVSKMMTGVMSFIDKLSDRVPKGGDGSVWARLAERAVDVLPNLSYNFALARQAAAGVSGTAPAPQPPPQLDSEDAGDDNPNSAPSEEELAMRFLDQIEQPLIHALSSGAAGQEFGALLMKTHGADTYEFIAGQSDDALFGLLRNSQAIWSTVQKMSQRFVQFLQEFRDREKVRAIFQQMNLLAQSQTHQSPAATATATAPPPPPLPQAAPRPAQAPGGSGGSGGSSGSSAPSQVTRRLKPGQRVVHTPAGQQVVDVDTTIVPGSVSGGSAASADPEPGPSNTSAATA